MLRGLSVKNGAPASAYCAWAADSWRKVAFQEFNSQIRRNTPSQRQQNAMAVLNYGQGGAELGKFKIVGCSGPHTRRKGLK